MNYPSHLINGEAPLSLNAEADLAASVCRAAAEARAAQERWSRTPISRRLSVIRTARGLIAQNAMQLAEASAAARSRPIVESLTAEVVPLAEAARFLERKAGSILAPRSLGKSGLPLWLRGVRAEIHREPLGVVLIIGPGNYPLLLPGVQLLQALASGNAVLLKPGVGGTAAAKALLQLLVRAGLDPALVALLPESSMAAQAAIAARPDKVIFTGSATTGENILRQLAPHLIPATMELSGCDAVIIRADADLDLAVRALSFGLVLNGGATCMSPKRVFVSATRATELEGRLAQLQNAWRQTPDQRPAPLPPGLVSKWRPMFEGMLADGAHLIAGEIREDGTVLAPLIFAGVSPFSPLLREDIFAPVLSIVTVGSDDKAIRCANDCPFALSASIFSGDEYAARRMAARIHAGVVTINDLIIPTADPRVPFGGRSQSGFGVTRGAEGLLELTVPKVITVSRGKFRPAFEPARAGDARVFSSYLELTHGRRWKPRIHALIDLVRALSSRRTIFQKGVV